MNLSKYLKNVERKSIVKKDNMENFDKIENLGNDVIKREDKNKSKRFYHDAAVMTVIGTVLGYSIGFLGTIYSSNFKLKEIENQHIYELENKSLDKKEEICTEMIQSIYSLQKMNDGLIEPDLPSFKSESYTILAKAKIYCDEEVVELYDQFLSVFFKSTGKYDGVLVDKKLIPAIRKDLGVDE